MGDEFLVKPFHITVGTSIEPGGKPDLKHDLRLLKAALLYGDKVKLCSLGSSLVMHLAQYRKLTSDEIIQVATMLFQNYVDSSSDENVQRVSPLIPILGELQRNRKLKRELKSRYPYEVVLQIHKLDKEFGNLVKGIVPAFDKGIDKITGGVKLNELELAVDSGLIEFQSINPDSNNIGQDYFDIIANAIQSDQTYPLLDNPTGRLVDAAIKEGMIDVSEISVARARGVGLASDSLQNLPLFDNASVDEVISIRRELEKPLIRFRSSMIEFSAEINSATWDRDFPLECETVFHRKVRPAILEIEESVRDNRRLRVYRETFVKEKGIMALSSLGLIVASSSGLIDTVSQFLSASAPPLAWIIMESERQIQEHSKLIERNQLYFYYKSGQLLRNPK